MGDVIYVRFKEAVEGPAKCLECGYEWYAEAPKHEVELKCPNCETMKGVWRGLYKPPSPVFVCNCGNDLFFVGKSGIKCCRCGIETPYRDLCE